MRPLTTALFAAALLAGVSIPAQAQSLLGIVGGSDSGALVTLGSGEAGTSGVVNLGVGGSSLVDANVGDGNIASATVGSNSGGGLGADVSLLNDTATVGVDLGGSSLATVDVGLGGGTLVQVDVGGGSGSGGSGGGGNGGSGGNGGGGNGGAGSGASGGNGTSGGNGGGGIVINGGGFASNSNLSAAGLPRCAGLSNRDLERLLQSTRIDGSWSRASGVNVQQVALCPEQRSWLASALPNSSVGQQLRSAVTSDALISASLSRTSYGADRVLAIQKNGSQLTVFVY